jgi:hypothetical protein
MGKRVGQDLLYDTPRLFSAALIFFLDNVYYKANPDCAPLLSIYWWFHDPVFPMGKRELKFLVLPVDGRERLA